MAIEIEKKFRLTNEQFVEVEPLITELNAEYFGEQFEENILYTNQIIFKKGGVVRVRKTDNKCVLTYKGLLKNTSDKKIHIEHETNVEKPEEIEKILEYLMLEKTLVYEKYRKTWRLNEVEVVLDKLPFGYYMEIEGKLKAIKETEKLLNAEKFEVEQKTYPFLTKLLGRKNGNIIEARF